MVGGLITLLGYFLLGAAIVGIVVGFAAIVATVIAVVMALLPFVLIAAVLWTWLYPSKPKPRS